MKALVYTGVETLYYCDMPDPVLREHQILVKIDSVGICGSDMHAFLGHDERRPPPLILGHEAAGVVAGGASEGLRVTINPLASCGGCRACRGGRDNLCPDRQIISMPPCEGGFAQFVAIPIANTVMVPEAFSLEKASLAEPLACGWHAVRLSQEALDQSLQTARCLVIGGGAIGVGAALALCAMGSSDITVLEPNELRRDYLLKNTHFQVIDPIGLSTDRVFDLVIDGVGYAQTRAKACGAVRPGGVIAHIGLGSAEGGMDIRRLTLQEITFFGTYTYTAQDFQETANAMFEGRLGLLDWYETRPLEAGLQAFSDIRQGRVSAPKIIFKP
jgi:threonine dehydrogenase-like Zn-dependent dehydrogenase